MDPLNPDDDLPRIDSNLGFDLSDREVTLTAVERRGQTFDYNAAFEISSPVDALLVGNEGGNGLFLQTNQNALFAGQDGNDILVGGTGDDFFFGGGGSDSMLGGEGSDTFLFGQSSGRDLVAFEDGADLIELSRISPLLNFERVIAAATPSGGNTVIDIGAASGFSRGTDLITLVGVDVDALDPTDFDFTVA